MYYRLVVIPDQIVLSLIVMKYRAVIMPAHLRGVIRLNVLILEVERFER